MRWKRLMILFWGGLLVLLVASYAAFRLIDLNRFKPQIVRAAKEATGLAMVLRGDIKIGLRPGVSIIINDISIRNAGWGQRSEMITIRRCEVDLALLPLIKGVLEIKRLLLLEPDVFLEISAGGEWNLQSKGQEGTPIFPAREVAVEKGVLTYRDYRSGKSYLIHANRLRVATSDQNAPVRVNFDGKINGRSLKTEGTLGSLAAFIDPREPWAVHLDLNVEQQVSITVRGTITDKERLQGMSLSIHAEGQSLAKVLAAGDIKAPLDPGPFTLSARMTDAGGSPSIKEIDLKAGTRDGTNIRIHGEIENVLAWRGIHIDFAAHFTELAELKDLPGKPFEIKGPLSVSGHMADTAQKVYWARDLQLFFSQSMLTGSLGLDLRDEQPRLNVHLASQGIDLRYILDRECQDSLWMNALQKTGPFELKFAVADPAGRRSIEDLELVVGTAEQTALELKGAIHDFSGLRGADLHFTVRGKDAASLGKLLQTQLPFRGAFVVAGKMVERGEGVLSFEDIQALVGESKINGSIELNMVGEKPLLKSALVSRIQDPENLFVPGSLFSKPGRALSLMGEARWAFTVVDPAGKPAIVGLNFEAGAKDFAEVRIQGSIQELPVFGGVELGFSVQGNEAARLEEVFERKVPVRGPFALSGRLLASKPRGYKVEELEARLGQSEVHGRLAISQVQDILHVAAELSAEQIDPSTLVIQELGKAQVKALEVLGPWNLALRASVSTAEIAMESLDLRFGHKDLAETRIAGSIRDLMKWQGVDLEFSIQGKDLKNLEKIAGEPLALTGPFALSGRLDTPATKMCRIRDLDAIFGDNDLVGSFELDFAGDRPRISADLSTKKFDLRPLLGGLRKEPHQGQKLDTKEKRGEKVFSARPLPLDLLDVVNAAVQLKAGQILLPHIAVDDLSLGIALLDGNLRVHPFRLAIGGGTLEGLLDLQKEGDEAKVGVNLRVSQANLGAMFDELRVNPTLNGTMGAEINLQGRGRSIGDFMALLNGRTVVAVSNGRIYNKYLDPLGGSLLIEIFRLVNPLSTKEESSELHCHINQFDIKDGVAASKVWVTDTKYTTLKGGGGIDLKSEKVQLLFETSPKKGIGIPGFAELNLSIGQLSRTFVVGGTLADPSLTVDPKGVALTIGKMLGGFALLGPFGIAAGLLDLKLGEDNPCVKALEAIEKENGGHNSREENTGKEDNTDTLFREHEGK